MKFSVAHSSRLGNRKNNQDRCAFFSRERYLLLVLADGMGGHEGGEKAAQITIDTFETVFNNIPLPLTHWRSFLQQIIFLSHKAIQESCPGQVNIPRTTCVACLVKDDQIMWAHTGDSRLYLIRDGHIYNRTRDHSYIQDLLQLQAVTEHEATVHPMRHYVTACLGGSGTNPHVSISETTTLKNNDFILLCSDGLWSAFDDKQLLSALGAASSESPSTPNLEQTLDELTDMADKKNYPHSDNTTGLAVSIEDCSPPSGITSKTLQSYSTQNADALQQAIEQIETAYHLYKNEIK